MEGVFEILKKFVKQYSVPIEVEKDVGRILVFCKCDQLLKACPECREEIVDYVDKTFCGLKVLTKLMLKIYGVEAEIDDSWEGDMRYLILTTDHLT